MEQRKGQSSKNGLFEEKTAAKVAGFLHAIGLDVHAYMVRTGVRGDWMEQDGPEIVYIRKMAAIGHGGGQWLVPVWEWETHAGTMHKLRQRALHLRCI